ncbi:hypothetical protein, partial [Lysinibacillus sp. NPDC096259]|uniref:hypothetical protein n=1 Tax=Lysinibacillus sp. NPDC096259 TaxID=3390583 RepID=UPI003CFCCA03
MSVLSTTLAVLPVALAFLSFAQTLPSITSTLLSVTSAFLPVAQTLPSVTPTFLSVALASFRRFDFSFHHPDL